MNEACYEGESGKDPNKSKRGIEHVIPKSLKRKTSSNDDKGELSKGNIEALIENIKDVEIDDDLTSLFSRPFPI
jgi:hypothetical protein